MNPRAITLLIATIFACSINGDQCCAWTDVCAILDGRCCVRTWCIRRTFPDNPNIEPNESGFVIRPYNCTTEICEGYDDPRSSGLRCQGSNKWLSGIGRWLEHFDGNNLLVLTLKQDILIFHKMQSNHILWSLTPTIYNNAVILDLTKNMKNNKYHTAWTYSYFNGKITDSGKIDNQCTPLHDPSLS